MSRNGKAKKPPPSDARRGRFELAAGLLSLATFVAALALSVLLRPGHVPLRAPAGADVLPWSSLQPQATHRPAQGSTTALAMLADADPRAAAMLRDLRAEGERAPTVPGLEGRAVALAGFVVPLDGERRRTSEFLLVPYFGACIHTPPPPANQVVHVRAAQPLALEAMDQVLVRGIIRVEPGSFAQAASGYRIDAARVEVAAAP